MKWGIYFIGLAALVATSCHEADSNQITLADPSNFTQTIDNEPVALYTLFAKGAQNQEEALSKKAIIVQITNYGGRIVSLLAPDKTGKYADVALGYNSLDEYINNTGERYLGPIIGRYGNRIANGQFAIDDMVFTIPQNNNGQCLHGGIVGFDKSPWKVVHVDNNSLTLSLLSPDGTDGFPGNIQTEVRFSLGNDNDLHICYTATTDKTTVLNLTDHVFFNLAGEGSGTILNHILQLNASHFTPVSDVLIPTGEVANVFGSPFDFRTPTRIGERIDNEDPQLKNGKGYDHNWVLDRHSDKEAELAVVLTEPTSGRVLEVFTDQPGIQFYSGNFFSGTAKGKSGKPLAYREGLALETQKFPDSPNQPQFPSTRLEPGETYTHTCIYQFSTTD